MLRLLFALLALLGVVLSGLSAAHAYENVAVKNDRLVLDGVPQPVLFGAELQYFRLRGGYGRNVPMGKVQATWLRALTEMRIAGMNAISFYIPWDFHEYAEGRFDFTGTVDEDGDGRPDYPSRNVVGFLQLAQKMGFDKIMVRPGPYINAEWGFLGFGAIPFWFHEKYPDSHMRDANGLRTKLYDYHNPDLLRHTQIWFSTVYSQVLKPYIGGKGPIAFLQIDNETNFMWQSIFNHDYGVPAKNRYREFLQSEYNGKLELLNANHERSWSSWPQVEPATQPGLNVAEDQDWYRFQDWSIFTYLQKIRRMWEALGVKEPQVIFSLAESYNAMAHGLLPNFEYRNAPGQTGLLTVNLYPKTWESQTLFNVPFKSDLDVKSAVTSNARYWGGQKQEWVLGPEVHSGWWRGIHVSPEARRQTYLSVLAHGMKAIFIYYFNEGYNWQVHWAKEQLQPLFDELVRENPAYQVPPPQLPWEFWSELQKRSDKKIIVGLDVKRTMTETAQEAEDLYFDAPLDGEGRPRQHFSLLKEFGNKILAADHNQFLVGSREALDDIAILKDVRSHVPSRASKVDPLQMNAEWSASLLAALFHIGYNPDVLVWGLSSPDFSRYKVIVRQDADETGFEMARGLQSYIEGGGRVINLLSDSLMRKLGLSSKSKACQPLRRDGRQVGQQCVLGKGLFTQMNEMFYLEWNSTAYENLVDVASRNRFLKSLVGAVPNLLTVREPQDSKIIAFARYNPNQPGLWLTVKSGEKTKQLSHIRVSAELFEMGQVKGLEKRRAIKIYDVREGVLRFLNRVDVEGPGFSVKLKPFDAKVFYITQ